MTKTKRTHKSPKTHTRTTPEGTMHRPESLQTWRTPKAVFEGLSETFGPFDIDLFADKKNALCDRFFTEKDDAIMQQWSCENAFGNPPYGRGMMHEAIKKAITEVHVAERCKRVVLLLKCDTSTQWFREACNYARVYLFAGRIQFERDGLTRAQAATGKSTGSNFANCVVVVDCKPIDIRPLGVQLEFLCPKTGKVV